jgi:hypothetical protein
MVRVEVAIEVAREMRNGRYGKSKAAESALPWNNITVNAKIEIKE